MDSLIKYQHQYLSQQPEPDDDVSMSLLDNALRQGLVSGLVRGLVKLHCQSVCIPRLLTCLGNLPADKGMSKQEHMPLSSSSKQRS